MAASVIDILCIPYEIKNQQIIYRDNTIFHYLTYLLVITLLLLITYIYIYIIILR